MLLIRDLDVVAFDGVLSRYGLQTKRVPSGAPIPGSYWGECEAGLVGTTLFLRDDTPAHSALHETSHFVCMDESRRAQLQRDAGGDHAEENAVCYLQIVLASYAPPMNRTRMQSDMDEWGYTFRLGSAEAWFMRDAADAKQWLQQHQLIDAADEVTWRLRR
jgi:hypothetical protein